MIPVRKTRWALVAVSWGLNCALLVAMAVWVMGDGRVPQDIEALEATLTAPRSAGGVPAYPPALWAVACCALASALGITAGLIWGPGRWRGLRTWLLATALASGWCGLIACWPTLYWQGQQWRVARLVPQAQELVASLRSNWPRADGEFPKLGWVMVYPKHKPSTLMLLGGGSQLSDAVGVASIEKTQDGALLLELTGPETGVWLEWRADWTEPRSFIGGLETDYKPTRWAQLAPGWRLVRYGVE